MRFSILICVILLAQVPKKPEQPIQSKKSESTAQEVQKQIEPLPTLPNPIGSTTTAPVSNPEQTSTANSYDGPHHLVTYTNLFCAALIALFTCLTWRVYKAMLRATKITERCWLVSDVGSIGETQIDGKYQVIVKIPNNGNTPAWITAAGSNGSWVDDKNPLPQKPQYDLMGPFPPNGQLLPPTAWLTQGFPLERIKLDQVVKKTLNLYIYGFVEYRDVYGDNHITRYCYKAKPPLDLSTPSSLDFYFDSPHEGYLQAT
jgi:hypothetical protein